MTFSSAPSSLYTIISLPKCLVITRIEGITVVGLIICLVLSLSPTILISTKYCIMLYPNPNIKAFESHLFYRIWSYMGSFITFPHVFNCIYLVFNSLYSQLHLYIAITRYHIFGLQFIQVKLVYLLLYLPLSNQSSSAKCILVSGRLQECLRGCGV